MATLKVDRATGMGAAGTADGVELITNLRWDKSKQCFSNDRGYVEFLTPDDHDTALSGSDVMSVYHWNRGSALLFEEYTTGNDYVLKARVGATTYTLDQGRKKALTSYVEIGSELLILNGEDRALIYSGEGRIRPAFFTQRPTVPMALSLPASVVGAFGRFSVGSYAYAVNKNGNTIMSMPGELAYGVGPLNEFISDPVDATTQVQVESNHGWQYAISYVTSTNSESPLSDLSGTVAIKYIGGAAAGQERVPSRICLLIGNIPKGPKGTVKRRLYRTKNQGAGNGRILYWVTDIVDNVTTSWVDCIPDSGLGSQAPDPTDSTTSPANLKAAVVFKNHLVATDGDQIFVSKPGRPEQFDAFGYLNPTSNGSGQITHLHATSSVAFVFREKGIDVLVPTDKPGLPFKLESITSSVGCLAPRTIVEVPKVGIVFLGSDRRFYAFTGREPKPIGTAIEEDTKRISRYHMDGACAAWCPNDEEYWAHVPIDGKAFNTVGFVLSVNNGAWSVRLKTPAQCMTTLPEGWVAFGSNAILTENTLITNSYEANAGVQVWCGIGGGVYYTAVEGEQTVVKRTTVSQSYIYETNYLDLGNADALKTVKSITLHGYALKGTHNITFEQDYAREISDTFEMLTTDAATPAEWGVSVIDGGTGDDVRTYQQNRWMYDQLVSVKIDVPLGGFEEIDGAPSIRREFAKSGTGCRLFKFKLSGNNDIDLTGYSVEFEIDGKRSVYSQGAKPAHVTKRF